MMKPIKTHLPALKAPVAWATRGGDTVYTTLISMRADGSVSTGDIREQTDIILDNLKQIMEAAGGSLADVTIIQIFMTDPADYAAMNEVYAKYYPAACPNRGTFYISGLAIPGLRIEIVAQAHIPEKR
jgi:enamine deaminase RidA (YjgF/YER057c/UK114 family)